MVPLTNSLAKRIAEATTTVFGESTLSSRVLQSCLRFEKDLQNIYQGRGIRALLIAIVGAKGQGKTHQNQRRSAEQCAGAGEPAGIRAGAK